MCHANCIIVVVAVYEAHAYANKLLLHFVAMFLYTLDVILNDYLQEFGIANEEGSCISIIKYIYLMMDIQLSCLLLAEIVQKL